MAFTDQQQDLYDQNWAAAFQHIFAPYLMKDQSPIAKWLMGRSGDFEKQYQEWAQGDASKHSTDFLGTKNPQADWMNMAPTQRGERPSQFAPSVQWSRIFGFR